MAQQHAIIAQEHQNNMNSYHFIMEQPPRSLQNSGMQNIFGIPQNSVGNSMGQGVPSNMFANSQYIYQQWLQYHLLKQKYQQQQQQQTLLQSNQFQSS